MNLTFAGVEVVPGNFYFIEVTDDISDPVGIGLAVVGAIFTAINLVYFGALLKYQYTPVFRYTKSVKKKDSF